MAYTYSAWSVVFGEQPTASKWNILGTNDASFDERIGSNFSSGTDSPIWWEELGRATLGGAADSMTASGLAARKYLQVRVNIINTGSVNALLQYNGDTGSNYAYRSSVNGGADATATAQTSGQLKASGSTNANILINIVNIATQSKIAISYCTESITAVSSAPQRLEGNINWSNATNAISSVTILNNSTGDFAAGSEVVVLGHD